MSPECWINFFLYGTGIACFCALCAPLFFYIGNGLKIRKREILTSFNDDAIKVYFQTFFLTEYIDCLKTNKPLRSNITKAWTPAPPATNSGTTQEKPEEDDVDMAKLRKKFNEFCNDSISGKKLVWPTIILLVVTAFCLVFTAIALKPYLLSEFVLHTTYPELYKWYYFGGIAGFAGGYMWVCQSLISRMQQRRLSRADICWSFFRILISVPVAVSLVSVIKLAAPSTSTLFISALCFMFGAFPTSSLMLFMRRIVMSKLFPQDPVEDNSSVLIQIQGITKDQVEEYDKEGVKTILQLAYADPIDLTVRTGYSFSYVVDCCSQALAWLSFENNMNVLRKYGMRGAMEIVTFELEYSKELDQDIATINDEFEMADKTLESMAKDLNLDKSVLRRSLYQVAWDPYAQLFSNVWQSDWN